MIIDLVAQMSNGGQKLSRNQLMLSRSIQMIHIGNLVHECGIRDLSIEEDFGNNLPADHESIVGNKVGILAGDFFLANAHLTGSMIRNSEVFEIVSKVMRDVVESEFIGPHSPKGLALPFRPGNIPKMISTSFEDSMKPFKLEGSSGSAEDEWMIRQLCSRGFLIAKGCHATCVLAKQPANFQQNCFELGKFFFLTCQAFDELETFKRRRFLPLKEVNLLSAPALYHLSFEPAIYEKLVEEADYFNGRSNEKLFNKIKNGPGINKTEQLAKQLKAETEKQLKNFPHSDAKKKIAKMLGEFFI